MSREANALEAIRESVTICIALGIHFPPLYTSSEMPEVAGGRNQGLDIA